MWYLCKCGRSKNAPNYRSNICKPFVCEQCRAKEPRTVIVTRETTTIKVRSLFAKSKTAHVAER